MITAGIIITSAAIGFAAGSIITLTMYIKEQQSG